MAQRWLPFVALMLACGGGGPSQPGPSENAPTADAAVRSFMAAVADSNITRMSRYWGTGKGPAGLVNQPSDYKQRMTVTQAYLRGSPYRIVRMDPVDKDRMNILVDLDRKDPDGSTCVRQVPFGVITTKYGWIVTSINLNLAGPPARPCGGPTGPG